MNERDGKAQSVAWAAVSRGDPSAEMAARERVAYAVPRPSRRRSLAAVRSREGFLLTAPALVLLLISVVYPIVWAVNLSVHTFDITNPDKSGAFVGTANYAEIVSSGDFRLALFNTFAFVISTLVFELVVAFPIALLLYRGMPGTPVFRLIFSSPLVVAPVVGGMLWQFMFADQYGAVNNLLATVGIRGPLWLADVWGARAAVLIANVWLASPFNVLVLLAGMTSLPRQLFEAARIDGAGELQVFRNVMLPLLRPALLIILVVRLTDAFRVFDIVYILTGGGPGGATQTLSVFIYKEIFTRLHFAQGSAGSFMMLVITVILSVFVIRVLRPKEELA